MVIARVGLRYGWALVAIVLGAAAGDAQQSATQQSAGTGVYTAQYEALLARYQPQAARLINAEAERVKANKGEPDPHFWDQLQALQEQLDHEFAPLLKAATAKAPDQALVMFINWKRASEIFPGLDANTALLAQINAAAPEWDKAFRWLLDQQVKSCNESNAASTAPEMTRTLHDWGLIGGDSTELVTGWQRTEACVDKAALLLSFDSRIDATWFNGFPTSSAHVRAEIKLKYDRASGLFVAKGVPLKYESFEFTTNPALPCDTAWGVSGTVDATAKMTAIPGQPEEYIIQVFPLVSEIVARLQLTPRVRSDADVGGGKRCADRKEEPSREHWNGFVLTYGNAPFRLRLNASDVLTGKPVSFGPVQFTQSTTVTLMVPGASK